MDAVTDYEKQRQENIRKNQLKLKELELLYKEPKNKESVLSRPSDTNRPAKRIKKATQKKPQPLRTLLRSRNGQGTVEPTTTSNIPPPEPEKFFTFDEYFDENIKKNAIRVDGKYHGWISRDLMEKYGIEASASEAWEANGGGAFSFKNPLGQAIKKSSKPSGWSDAKFIAHKMFKKNPNMYFYRHTEPGYEQWTGDWTTEEQQLFLDVAKEFGCGDKWGLFASHIPHRVGYQCSAYYRQEFIQPNEIIQMNRNVILPLGLIFDDSYRLNKNGSVVYVGSSSE